MVKVLEMKTKLQNTQSRELHMVNQHISIIKNLDKVKTMMFLSSSRA